MGSTKKIYKSLLPKHFSDRYLLRVGLFSALSVFSAYAIASYIPLVDPNVAAIIGLATMRPTFHDTIKEGLRQALGTLIGAIIAIVAIDTYGANMVSISLLVLLSFVLSWLLRIGEEGAVPIAITVIIISSTTSLIAVEGRLFGAGIGAVVALFWSYFILPGKPHERALVDSNKQSRIVGNILKEVSYKVRNGYAEKSEMAAWINKASVSIDKIVSIKEDAKDAVEGSRWSPLLKRKEAEQVLAQVEIADIVSMSVYSILLDLQRFFARSAIVNNSNSNEIADLLLQTAEGILSQAEQAATNPAVKIGKEPTELLITKKKKAADKLKNMDNTSVMILGGSLLSDVTKIRDAISQ